MDDGPYFDAVAYVMVGMLLFPFALVCLSQFEKAFKDYRWLQRRKDGLKASIFGTLLLIQIGAVVYTWWDGEQAQRRRTAPLECLSNVKQMGLAMMQYEQDNDSTMPPASTWADSLKPYDKFVKFHCPMARNAYGYAMNASLAGKSIAKLRHPGQTVVIFESDQNNRNAYGGHAEVAPNRHRGSSYAFADGHAKILPPRGLSTVKWTP